MTNILDNAHKTQENMDFLHNICIWKEHGFLELYV